MFGSNDPDNPMGGLLGDLLKVIGSGQGAGDNWFEAARTLAFGVATEDGQDKTPDPLVRIAFEDLSRVAQLHMGRGHRHHGRLERRGRRILRGRRSRAVVLPPVGGLPPHPQVHGRGPAAGHRRPLPPWT